VKRLSFLLGIGASLALSATALAGPSFTHATGSVGLTGPLQYASFNAFDYGATGDRGTVNYTNFEFGAAGTGVWNVGGTHALTTYLGASPYAHTMTINAIVPTSPTATTFSGTGFYNADPSYTWTVSGTVDGSAIDYTIVYTGTSAGYWFHAVGTIAADGSMSGTATDSALQAPLTWSMAAGSAFEVLSYTAMVNCAVIGGTDATFGFVIPAGSVLAGTPVAVRVHDGGTPGTNGDTWAHGVGTCGAATSPYTIVSGNLVVH
jgi:hypothetical protein